MNYTIALPYWYNVRKYKMEHEMSLSTLHILFLHRKKNCYLQKAFMLFVRLSDARSSSPSALFLLVKSVTSQQRRKKHRISWRKVSDCLKLHREAKSKRLTHAHTDPVSSSLSQRDHFVTSKYFRFFHCFQHPRYPRALHNFHYSVLFSYVRVRSSSNLHFS